MEPGTPTEKTGNRQIRPTTPHARKLGAENSSSLPRARRCPKTIFDRYRLLARPPRREHDQQVLEVHGAVSIEVGAASEELRTRTPRREEDEEVGEVSLTQGAFDVSRSILTPVDPFIRNVISVIVFFKPWVGKEIVLLASATFP